MAAAHSIGPYWCVCVLGAGGEGGGFTSVSFPTTRLYPDDKRQLAFSNDSDEVL